MSNVFVRYLIGSRTRKNDFIQVHPRHLYLLNYARCDHKGFYCIPPEKRGEIGNLILFRILQRNVSNIREITDQIKHHHCCNHMP
uniref:Uncharacterized protein n=1 Tax=Podoviridae sp. ctZ5d16 TaxID=2825257 RepID=A0A8S5Q9T3_9CAUD|nr:MAG TPA: hypothetical protein [Podoviridae sp. ctZ5d16]